MIQVGKASLIDHLIASYENSKREGKPFSMKGKTVNSVLKSAQGVYEVRGASSDGKGLAMPSAAALIRLLSWDGEREISTVEVLFTFSAWFCGWTHCFLFSLCRLRLYLRSSSSQAGSGT